jgi:hypothetical protein
VPTASVVIGDVLGLVVCDVEVSTSNRAVAVPACTRSNRPVLGVFVLFLFPAAAGDFALGVCIVRGGVLVLFWAGDNLFPRISLVGVPVRPLAVLVALPRLPLWLVGGNQELVVVVVIGVVRNSCHVNTLGFWNKKLVLVRLFFG